MNFLKNLFVLILTISFWYIALGLWILRHFLPEGEFRDILTNVLKHVGESIAWGGGVIGWLVIMWAVILFLFSSSIGSGIMWTLVGWGIIWISRKLKDKARKRTLPQRETSYQKSLRHAEEIVANPLSYSAEEVNKADELLKKHDQRLIDLGESYVELERFKDGNYSDDEFV